MHEQFPFLIVFCGVASAGWFGRSPALAAVMTGAATTWYFILPPALSFGGKQSFQILQMLAFVLAGSFIGLLTGSLRKAHDNVQDREGQLRVVAEAMPEILFTANSAGHIETLSDRFREFTGKTLKDVGPWGWIELLHPDEKEATLTEWKKATNSQAEFRATSRLRCKDGTFRWFQSRAIAMQDRNRRVIRWLGVCADIDDQKQLEGALSRSNEELERFAFAASHDLQEPLRMVGAFSDLLVRKDRTEDAESTYLVRQIQIGVQRMRELIDASLEYSRMVSEGVGERVPGSLEKPLEEALWSLQQVVEESGAEIIREPLPEALADQRMVARVFQNLISNAIKFRSEARPVVRISAVRDGSQCTVQVADNGIGMPASAEKTIFHAFRRLHRKSEYAGSGLGLATVKRIIELHHGRIWVESAPGEGSKFFFTLPVSGGG